MRCIVASLFLAVAMTSNVANAVGRISSARCVMNGHLSCGADGECFASGVSSKYVITFDFGKKRYSSSWGSGRITQSWDAPDGSHKVIISSPPASAEISFSPDWRNAGVKKLDGSATVYICEVIARSR